MKITLSLRAAHQTERPTAAWYVPGDDVHAWLELICQSGWNQDQLRIAVLRGADQQERIAGALLIPAFRHAKDDNGQAAALAGDLRPHPWIQPYGEISGRLYLPTNATLSVPVADSQCREIMADDEVIYVWHPVSGLTEYPLRALLHVSDLLAREEPVSNAWDAAEPGLACNMRLHSLQPSVALTFESLLAQTAEDIGSRTAEWRELRPSPAESLIARGVARAAPALNRLSESLAWLDRIPARVRTAVAVALVVACLAWILSGFAGWVGAGLGLLALVVAALVITAVALVLLDFARNARGAAESRPAPGGPAASTGSRPGRKTWRERLQGLPGVAAVSGFVRRQTAALRESIEAARYRAVARLLHALESDPDRGLQFALPLHGEPHRGVAPPGWTLGPRSVDFSLGRLSGGAPADHWNLDQRWRLKLQERYQELARREIALGRYRRAAYIYAELLGDYASAASTLVSGAAFREAAVLYQHKLHSPEKAADCLRRGGLLTEAIEIYERLEKWETVGDLQGQLDQSEPAREAYLRAIAQSVGASDYLNAARLADRKLDEPELAWANLRLAWPDQTQAARCLAESFQLAARRNRHQDARAQIPWAEERATTIEAKTALAGILAQVATTYPEAGVRCQAADKTRLIASAELDQAPRAIRLKLTESLTQLEPRDLLLARDGRRFHEERRAPRVASLPTKASSHEIELVRQWSAPFECCLAAVGEGERLLVAGWRKGDLLLARCGASGSWQHPREKPWRVQLTPHAADEVQPVHLAWNGAAESLIVVNLTLTTRGPLIPWQVFAVSDEFPERWMCGSVGHFTLAAAYGDGGDLAVASVDDSGALQIASYMRGSQRLLGTRSYPEIQITSAGKLAVSRGKIYFAMDRNLWVIGTQGEVVRHELAHEVTDLAVSPTDMPLQLAVATAHGVEVLWGDMLGEGRRLIAPESRCRALVFDRLARLWMASETGLTIVQVVEGQVRLVGAWRIADWHPVALIPRAAARECVAVAADGLLRLFRR